MAYVPNSGSVVSFQSQPSSLLVGASVIGLTPVAVTNTPSISGTVLSNLQSTNASIISVSQGSVATVIIGGSIAASFTPPANQSVSGTVHVDNLSSVIAYQLAGSILATSATVNPAANQSVSGSVGIVGNPSISGTVLVNNGSVVAFQGTSPWTVTSSIAGGIFPISGSVAATVTNTNINVGGSVVAFQGAAPWAANIGGSIAAVIIGGSVATATTNSSVFLLNSPNTIGSVVAYQGITPWVVVASVYQGVGWSGSVAATVTNTVNVAGSVVAFQAAGWSGSVVAFQGGARITSLVSTTPSSVQVGASIMGIAPVTLTANTVPPATSVLVGVTANTNGSVATTTGYPQAVMQITSGPGASITGQVNFEGTIDGTQFVPIQGYNFATNAIASAAGVESNWAFNTAGLQGIRARVSNWTVGSITARVVLSPADARPFSNVVFGNPSISGQVGASVVGQLPAGTAMLGSITAYQGATPWAMAGSVAAFQAGAWSASVQTLTLTSIATAGQVIGSVATLQGTSPWVVNFQNSSVFAAQQGTWKTSIASNYATGAASVISGLGNLILGVRNDGLGSVLAANAQYGPLTTGSWGDLITSSAPQVAWTTGVGSCFTGVEQPIIASVAGNYINVTGVQIANNSANNVYMSFYGAGVGSVTGSIIGFTVAPANGGSNILFPVPLRTGVGSPFSASVSGVASVYISAQGFFSKA